MPRLADLKDQQLYRLDRSGASNKLTPVFRGAVEVALIAEQWDQLARLAASLRNRTAPPHVVMDRLVASSPSDRLAKALTMLGAWNLSESQGCAVLGITFRSSGPGTPTPDTRVDVRRSLRPGTCRNRVDSYVARYALGGRIQGFVFARPARELTLSLK
jgi:hypothetical protein